MGASARAFLMWTVMREDGSRVFIWLMRAEHFVSLSLAGCWRKQEVLAAGREESRAWWLQSHRDCSTSLEDYAGFWESWRPAKENSTSR